jgi:hypothetical protein
MLRDRAFNLFGAEGAALGHDREFAPSADHEFALRVEVAEIARVESPLRVERARRFIRVAVEHRGPREANDAGLAGGELLARSGVHDGDR